MFPSVALAYRPFVSTDAAVADAGEVEVELGYAGFRRDGSGTTIVAPALIANLGVTRDLEVVGEFKLVNDLGRSESREHMRFEDSAISLKWVAREGALQEHGPAPSVAVELSVLLPTLRGEDGPGGELVGIVSARALGRTSVRGSAANSSALAGTIWSVAAPAPLHELSFDVGVRHGISGAADGWGGTAGLTFAFPWSRGHDGGTR